MSGLLATAIVGFGLRLVRVRSLVPRPAARMSPFICCPLSEVESAERIAPGVHGPYAADHTACVHELGCWTFAAEDASRARGCQAWLVPSGPPRANADR